MDITISPSKLIGRVEIPSSKSYSHRAVIAAALAKGVSEVSGVTSSKDIEVTCAAMEALGANIIPDGGVYTVKGIETPASSARIDCGESGSTMRFIIPVATALGTSAVLSGHGKLPERPYTPYVRELSAKGITFDRESGLPLSISGRLQPGVFSLEGDISSQFITGLLYALPLCGGDSEIRLTTPLQSKPYVDMTISTLKDFGIEIAETSADGLPVYKINGGQTYHAARMKVEGDYSQAAFFFVANALGSEVDIQNLSDTTVQGDRAIVDIIRDNTVNGVLHGFTADAGDIPDLVPVLSVLGCIAEGTTHIVNASRLRIKESDRLMSTAAALNAIGGRVTVGEDDLVIEHIDRFTGGTVDACNDHRIVMAAAVAATASEAPVTIHGAEAVTKSYPHFFKDFASLGGIVSSDII